MQEDPEALVDGRLLGDPKDARELVLERARAVGVDVRGGEDDAAAAQGQKWLQRRLVARGDHVRAATRVPLGVQQVVVERRGGEDLLLLGRHGLEDADVDVAQRLGGALPLRPGDERRHLEQLQVTDDRVRDVEVSVEPARCDLTPHGRSETSRIRKSERRYRMVEPENRLVARGLETEWESHLRRLDAAEAELRRREQQRPGALDKEQLKRIQMLSSDIRPVWTATTTTDRDRKELLRTLLEEVVFNLKRAEGRAHLTLRWRGGAITTLDVPVPGFRPMGPRTDEDTISLLRRLAALYPDEVIAGILNRQGRKTATGERFNANQVGSLRRYRNIPRFQPSTEPAKGEMATIRKAARILGLNTSTIHRWLADGFIAGEQVTPGAPWQIRITDELRARVVAEAPPEYLPMLETTMKLGVSRQTVLQRVKRGELQAMLVTQGRRKGLRIKMIDQQSTLFEQPS